MPEANACASLEGGETRRGLPRRVHARPRLPPRLLPARASPATPIVGDMAGVRIPPSEFTLAPTPPPDIDVEAWRARSTRSPRWNPQALVPDPLRPGRRRRRAARPRARRCTSRPTRARIDGDGVRRGARAARSARAATGDRAAALRAGGAARPAYLGLERYWRKRRANDRRRSRRRAVDGPRHAASAATGA